MKGRLWSLLCTCLLVTPLNLAASETAVDFTSTQNWGFGAGLTIGWGFTVSEPLIVDELGYYDHGQDGFVFDHDVGLFRVSDMSLLSSGTVTSGDTLDGLFRYTNVAPMVVNPGETYYVAGYDPAFCPGGLNLCGPTADPHDQVGNPPFSGITFAPQITFDGWQTESTSSLQFASYNPLTIPWANSDGPLMVANFKLQPVPIPAAVWLFGSGLLGLVSIARRRYTA